MVDDEGDVVERYSYEIWGEPTVYDASGNEIADSALGNPYMFTAREFDILDNGNLKLQHSRHRPYYYRLGRWMTNDPLDVVPEGYRNDFNTTWQYADGLNIYEYVKNTPGNLVDIFGLNAPSREMLDPKLNSKEYVPIWSCYYCMLPIANQNPQNPIARIVDWAWGKSWGDVEHEWLYYGDDPWEQKSGEGRGFNSNCTDDTVSDRQTATKCRQYWQVKHGFLMSGPNAGKVACKCATVEQIWECVKSYKPRKKYTLFGETTINLFATKYTCDDWVREAASKCCIKTVGKSKCTVNPK